MRIAYDGMPFEHSWIEGMLVYNRQLLTHLFRLFPDNDYCFVFNSLRQNFANVDLPNGNRRVTRTVMRFPTLPWPRLELKMYFDIALPHYLRKQRIDLFHGMRYHVPPSRRTRVVTTFHDIFARVIPDIYTPRIKAERELWYRRALDRSDRIIAVSNSTRADLMHYYKVPEEKITVINLAASEVFRPITNENELNMVRQRYQIDYNYFFALGSHPTRKNTERIFRAMAQLKQQRQCDHKLVLFSVSDRHRQEWSPLIRQLGLDNKVVFLNTIPNEDLSALYSMADIFLYPSLYEGFGIPIVEAMSCGTPVITSNVSAMPEVAGKAALLVNPLDVEELAEAMRLLLDDSARRSELRDLGLKRAKEFSWEKAARQTMAVYESLA